MRERWHRLRLHSTTETIRFRSISVLTNTPPRVAQRAPGGEQASAMLEPLISKAARQLKVDQVEIRKINAPVTGAEFGPPPPPQAVAAALAKKQPPPPRNSFTSCHLSEALDLGAKLFSWEERKQRNGQRRGSKVTGVGVGLGTYTAGSIAMDGLLLVRPDGKVYVQTGVGNLGTGSVHDTARIVAEELATPWEQFEIVWGNTGKHLAWSSPQAGSQTIHAHTRAHLAAAQDLKKKLQEIAALEMGGRPESYTVANGRVGRMTFAQAAEAAIKRGGKFDGHEAPGDINAMTKASVAALVGEGLIGVARDNFGRKGSTQSWVASFAEVEVDVETGEYKLIDYCAATDCGTVINPRGLAAQLHGGGVQGFGHIRSQKWVYDQRYGVSLANRFHYNKPPTILDIPLTEMQWGAVGIPDSQTPIGAKGIGEPAICAGAAAAICAVNAAIGDDYLRRTPATPSMILASLDAGKRVDEGLVTHV
jgi:CO/xanthine dehydrogenase Mo-binding subunit